MQFSADINHLLLSYCIVKRPNTSLNIGNYLYIVYTDTYSIIELKYNCFLILLLSIQSSIQYLVHLGAVEFPNITNHLHDLSYTITKKRS